MSAATSPPAALSAGQIVARNERLGNLAHSDHAVEVVPVSEVTFGGGPGDG